MQIWLKGKNTEININGGRENSMYINPDLEGFSGLPEIRTSQGVNIGMDGGWTGEQNFEARFLSIIGVIADHDIAVVEQKRRELFALLAEKRLLLRYVTDAGNTYTTNVVVLGVVSGIGALRQKAQYKLNLKADDPLWYDYGGGSGIVATLQIGKPEGGFRFPVTFPLIIEGGGSQYTTVKNTGTSTIDPVITIFGPIHQPKVINQTTNQFMQILADLTANDVVIVNTHLKTIVQVDKAAYDEATNNGTEPSGTDIYYLKSDGSTFIKLASGDNNLALTSAVTSDTGRATVKFSSGFMGI